MQIKNKFLGCIMVALLLIGAADVYADAINWRSYIDLQKGSEEAEKKFFIFFSSQSCSWCRLLESKTFKDKDIVSYLNANYRPVRISIDTEPKLAQAFSVTGVPDLRFLSPEGKQIARWPGYIEAKDLINLLKFIHTDSYQKMSYSDFIKQQ
jgi:thioredoxin-related protein